MTALSRFLSAKISRAKGSNWHLGIGFRTTANGGSGAWTCATSVIVGKRNVGPGRRQTAVRLIGLWSAAEVTRRLISICSFHFRFHPEISRLNNLAAKARYDACGR